MQIEEMFEHTNAIINIDDNINNGPQMATQTKRTQ